LALDPSAENLAQALKVLVNLGEQGLSSGPTSRSDEGYDWNALIGEDLRSIEPGHKFTEKEIEQIHAAWGKAWEAMRTGQLFNFQMGVPTPMKAAVMHRNAAHKLMELRERDRAWDGEPLTRKAVFQRALGEGIEAIEEMVRVVKEPGNLDIPAQIKANILDESAQRVILSMDGMTGKDQGNFAFCSMEFGSSFRDSLKHLGDSSGGGHPL